MTRRAGSARREPSSLEEFAHARLEPTGPGPRMIDIVLPPEATSVPEARHAVAGLLYDVAHVSALVIEDVLLLVSELVTNAVLHAGTEVRLHASVEDAVVSVSVSDGDPHHAPVLARRGADATSGRGILLVHALAEDWGVELAEASKLVWFQASYAPEPEPELDAAELLARRLQRS
ncbi:MAG: ATP-binding protein [Acidimicrobiales bacterium]